MNWVRKVLKCLLEMNYGSYFCFSDCVALTTTVPFHRLLALTAFIFRAVDFIGHYTHLPLVCNQWEVHRLSEHADRLSRRTRHTACKIPCNSKKISKYTNFRHLHTSTRSKVGFK